MSKKKKPFRAVTPGQTKSSVQTSASTSKKDEEKTAESGQNTMLTRFTNGLNLTSKTLTRTQQGQAKIDQIRRSKNGIAGKYVQYDPTEAVGLVETMFGLAEGGAYAKLQKQAQAGEEVLAGLIDAFCDQDNRTKEVFGAIAKLLRICRSIDEYGNGKLLTDEVYDRIRARWVTDLGFTEPKQIVPNNGHGKKVDIRYPKLHNDMQKAYALRNEDEVPAGVKETSKVEEFILKAFDAGKIDPKTGTMEVELSPKMDGVSVNATVKNGKITEAMSRGSDDKALAIKGLEGYPVNDGNNKPFGIQYELFVTDDNRIKAAAYLKRKQGYAGNRQAASGILNRMNTEKDEALWEFINLFPIEITTEGMSYLQRMDEAQNFGNVPDGMFKRKVIKGNLEKILKGIEDYFEKLEELRDTLAYSVDGVVITIADDRIQQVMGRKDRTNMYQMAYKFEPVSNEAKVDGLHLDVGKKGFRTIQIDLDKPIYIDGVKYTHVPVASTSIFEDLDMRVGSTIQVVRTGDVIPAISVISKGDGKKLELPTKCPVCGKDLVVRNKKLFCQSETCAGNIIGRLVGFMDGIGLVGYADSFIEDVLDRIDSVKSPADLLALTPELLAKNGITGKLAEEFHGALTKQLEGIPDYKLLGSFGIPDIGPERARDILKAVSWDKLVNHSDDNAIWRLGEEGVTMRRFVNLYLDDKDELAENLDAFSGFVNKVTDDRPVYFRVGHTGIEVTDIPQIFMHYFNSVNCEFTDGKRFDLLIAGSKDGSSEKLTIARNAGIPIIELGEMTDVFYLYNFFRIVGQARDGYLAHKK